MPIKSNRKCQRQTRVIACFSAQYGKMIVSRAFRKENGIRKSWFGCIYNQLIWCFSSSKVSTRGHCSISCRTFCSMPWSQSQPDSVFIQLTGRTNSREPAWHKGTTTHKVPGMGMQRCSLWPSQLPQVCQTLLHRTLQCCPHCSSAALLSREERHTALGAIKVHLLLTLHQLQFWGGGNIPYSSSLLQL